MRDYILKLDVKDINIETEEIWFFTGDIGGEIIIELMDANNKINLNSCKVIALFEKKDKTVSEKELVILDYENSIIKAKIENSIISYPGKIKCYIKVYEGENVTTFSPFNIIAKRNISTDDVIESYTELDIIQEVEKNTSNIEINKNNIVAVNNNLKSTIEVLDSLSEVTKDNFKNVSESIVNINENVINDKKQTNENLKKLNKRIDNTQDLLKPIKENIEEIKKTKANIVISKIEPDTDGLELGTIWIKPLNDE